MEAKADTLVAVAMSGGVDSSVAALLLQREGYGVVGLTMKLWDPPSSPAPQTGEGEADKTCCTVDSAMDAKRVCDQLGIPHYTLDMRDDFEERVMHPFYEAYLRGETPNPCVNCNSFVKWDALWKRAKAVGADRIATGHYAATATEGGSAYILRGADPLKDQSYFLWGVPPESLARTFFPLGRLSKPEVRALAAEAGLRTADKSESQDICFVPGGDYREFIAARAAEKGDAVPAGVFVGPEGQDLGPHRGLPYYTVGQRRGLGVSGGEPLYVKKMEPATGAVVLGRKQDLSVRGFRAGGFNGFGPDWTLRKCLVQYRYRSTARPGMVERFEGGEVSVSLLEPGHGIAPGQSAVFYDGNRLIGGARIREVF